MKLKDLFEETDGTTDDWDHVGTIADNDEIPDELCSDCEQPKDKCACEKEES